MLGTSARCIATHASDFAVALAALDATVHVRTPAGTDLTLPFTALHVTPGEHPERETTLALVPLGYADGVPRQASGWGPVMIGARRFAVAGPVRDCWRM